jgi:predicted solute-binding protein
MLRIGCVRYLNARPLIRGWTGKVEFDHPSVLCRRLANGELDVALVSSFEYLRNPIYRIVDDVSISSDGSVYSVVVAHCGEFSNVEEIGLDPASQTSVNLLRCLLTELGLTARCVLGMPGSTDFQSATGQIRHGEPVVSGGSPDRDSARLLIGDQAIHFRQKHAGEFQFWDLGEQWKKLTGLPLVYALWLIRPEVTDAKSIADRLRKLRDKNLASLHGVIAEAVSGVGDPGNRKISRQFLARYFRKHLRFRFEEREKQGLQVFARLCAKHGLLPSRDFVFSVV